MTATPAYLEFAPPPPPGTGRSLGLALLVHFLLMVALTAGIQWKQDNSLSVEAELWAAIPMAVAPKLVEVEPPPPPPPPPPAPKEIVKPPPAPSSNVDADIALSKRKKQLEEDKKKQETLEAERLKQELLKKEEEKKAKLKEKEQKEIKDKALKEKELKEKEKKEKDRKEKELKDKEAKKLQEQKDAKPSPADVKKLEAMRQENMKRIAGMAGATGDENATGTAQRSAGPSDSYGGRIRGRIKPNITFTEDIASNAPAEVEVRCAPDGTIVGKKLIKSSGNPAWDNAVLKAIDKTEILPRDIDGRIHSPLVISFRPKD
ncbi:MAG: cell envelope integrity protein TolA [Limnohabitans sp.]